MAFADVIHLLLLVLFRVGVVSVNGRITCLNEEGLPVDMWVLYKLPSIHWHYAPHVVEAGKGYMYLDSNNTEFRFGNNSIGNHDCPPGRTLNQVYKKHYYFNREKLMGKAKTPQIVDLAHIFYNDADPQGKEWGHFGHTKGGLAFDEGSGFWLVSSVPGFPANVNDGYNYPHSGLTYGELMMCVTFKTNMFDEIGLQLLYTNPHVHDHHIPEGWLDNFPNLKSLLTGEVVTDSFLNIAHLESLHGHEYIHFAKAEAFNKDLYLDLVAPTLNTALICETWQHGNEVGPSCDGKYYVLDVLDVNITLPADDLQFSFNNKYDHSKFSIAHSPDKPYVCIGDINRQPSQFTKSGGTMCVSNIGVWLQFHKLIHRYSKCNRDEL